MRCSEEMTPFQFILTPSLSGIDFTLFFLFEVMCFYRTELIKKRVKEGAYVIFVLVILAQLGKLILWSSSFDISIVLAEFFIGYFLTSTVWILVKENGNINWNLREWMKDEFSCSNIKN